MISTTRYAPFRRLGLPALALALSALASSAQEPAPPEPPPPAEAAAPATPPEPMAQPSVPAEPAPAPAVPAAPALPAVPPVPAEPPKPPTVRGLVNDGVAAHRAGDYDGALAKFRQALEMAPKDELAMYEMANTLHAKQDWPRCIEVAEKALDGEPSHRLSPKFYALAGNCHAAAGDAKKAERTFEKALKVHPDDAFLLHDAALFALATPGGNGKAREQAIAQLARAIDMEPTFTAPLLALGKVEADRGRTLPALLLWLRFARLELTTERTREAARLIWGATASEGITAAEAPTAERVAALGAWLAKLADGAPAGLAGDLAWTAGGAKLATLSAEERETFGWILAERAGLHKGAEWVQTNAARVIAFRQAAR